MRGQQLCQAGSMNLFFLFAHKSYNAGAKVLAARVSLAKAFSSNILLVVFAFFIAKIATRR